MQPNVAPDDLLKMIGMQTVELRIAAQENAALRQTIASTENEVVRLRALIPKELEATEFDDAPAG